LTIRRFQILGWTVTILKSITRAIFIAAVSCGAAISISVSTPQASDAKNFLAFGDKGQCDSKSEEATVKSEKRAGDKVWHSAKILIKAPPKTVWETVHEERKKDPDLAYSKVLEQGVNECRLEQKFQLIPVIGTAVCEMHNSEVPLQRIDYKLLKSDRFKAMEGSWVLTPTEDGRHTMLELSTHLDMGIPVPGPLMTSVTSKKLSKRLSNVKKMAEQHHARVAAKEASGS
jgi:ribosome-associated toxin RatA of RatAB toxin-antitoxin module